jgi:hypothetical protein
MAPLTSIHPFPGVRCDLAGPPNRRRAEIEVAAGDILGLPRARGPDKKNAF